ncbi:MAG: stress protein [Aquabacterium sp.]|nr:MAG: stress protein [Aquabacterium sp.]
MKIHTQDHADFALLADKLGHARVAMLTRRSPAGELFSHPMTPLEMDRHGTFWFFVSRDTQHAQEVEAASLSFSDESRSDYVSISGSCELLVDPERAQQLWSPMARPWFPEGPLSPHLALMRFVPHSAEYWDSPGGKVVRLLALGASIAAGRPLGLGEHGRIEGLSTDAPA